MSSHGDSSSNASKIKTKVLVSYSRRDRNGYPDSEPERNIFIGQPRAVRL